MLFRQPQKTRFSLIAGPCAIESLDQFQTICQSFIGLPVAGVRGGIFKLRTRADSFQGLGLDAVPLIRKIKQQFQLPLISEVTSSEQIPHLSHVVDVFQVGTRNMHNTELLKALGQQPKPVLLKRGLSAYIEEWLQAAEYIRSRGNENIILCERGIRTFETKFRNTLDLAAVAWLKKNCSYPIFVDPSHGTGRSDLVIDMSLAAAAAGADGLLVEVHPDPRQALSDGAQALDLHELKLLIEKLTPLLHVLGRTWEQHNQLDSENLNQLC